MTSNQPPQWPAGRILQKAREEASLSKREAARRAGITPSFYRRIEEGGHLTNNHFVRVNPSTEKLVASARAVGADVIAVISASGRNPADYLRQQLLQKVETLPNQLLPAALNLIDELDRQ